MRWARDTRTTVAGTCMACLAWCAHAPAQGQPGVLLPDLVVDENVLYDNAVVVEDGRRLLRLSASTPNIGSGKLYLRGGTINADSTRDVWQRVFLDDGTWWEHYAGRFIFHPEHDHIHLEGWTVYRLRERGADGSVGAIVAQGIKTSFCILDLAPYETHAAGFDPAGEFHSCDSSVQGLSVGWTDIYSKNLEGQTIDLTGVPDGDYWLECYVDPDEHIVEESSENNWARVPIALTQDATIVPDRFEPNDTLASVKTRSIGSANSPNLGPCGPTTVLEHLSIHQPGNPDYFRFYSPGTGTAASAATIEFDHAKGDLDLRLLNEAGSTLAQSVGAADIEKVSLSGRPRGWYTLLVYGFLDATQIEYRLTVTPAVSAPAAVTVLTPPPGDTVLRHGADTLRVDWQASDPDGDPTWVTVFLCPNREFDGTEIEIPTSVHTPGEQGFHIVNSAYVSPGTFWVYCAVTDGGLVSGAWSPGTVTFADNALCYADINRDGFVTGDDFDIFIGAFELGESAADVNGDSFVNGTDFDTFIVAFEAGC